MNNVYILFEIPLVGNFFTLSLMSVELTIMSVETYLGTLKNSLKEIKFNMGAHFRLSWLYDTYALLVEHVMY